MVLLFLLIGCTPTCEQTCSKLSKCGAVNSSQDVCVNSCNSQEILYEGWEEEHKEQKKEEAQIAESSGEDAEQSDVEYATSTEATQSTEDREESPHYSEQFDLWKTCVAQSSCEEISQGTCYDPEIYPF